MAFLLSSSSFLESPVSSCKTFCIECTANVNTGLLPLQQAPFYFATIECRGPPSETLPFPVVDARTSGEQLVLLQGAHVSDSQPIALALFRPRPLPATVLAWTPGRVLLLTLALSSSSSFTTRRPRPQADFFSTTRRQSPQRAHSYIDFAHSPPVAPRGSLLRPTSTTLHVAPGLTLPCTILRITTTLSKAISLHRRNY